METQPILPLPSLPSLNVKTRAKVAQVGLTLDFASLGSTLNTWQTLVKNLVGCVEVIIFNIKGKQYFL